MPCYEIKYRRKDMPTGCKTFKFANDEEAAMECFATGSKTKGYRLKLTGGRSVPIEVVDIREVRTK